MNNYYFFRHHIILEESDKPKILAFLEALTTKNTIKFRHYVYTFSGVEQIAPDLITGYFIKYLPQTQEQVFDENDFNIKEENIDNKITAKSFFLIDFRSSVIAFEAKSNKISIFTFVEMFSKLTRKNLNGIFNQVELSPINESYEFSEKLKKIKILSRLSIALFPSNPASYDFWEPLDQRLRETNTTKYHEKYENNKGGSIKIDSEFERKFAMSEDGYGVCKAFGKDDNNLEISISTLNSDKIVQIKLPECDFIMLIDALLKKIMEIFQHGQN